MTSPEDSSSVLPLSDDETKLIELVRSSEDRQSARSEALALLDRLVPDNANIPRQFNLWLAVALGLISGTLVRMTMYLDSTFLTDTSFFAKFLAFLVVPFIAVYFARTNGLSGRWSATLLGVLAIIAVILGLYPITWSAASAQVLTLHVPVVLLASVALALVGSEWRRVEARLRVIRFAAEWFVLFVLVALGGGVLLGLFSTLASEIGISIDPLMEWLLYLAPISAIVVTAALAAAESRLVSGACQLLTKLFVPLFCIMLVGFVVLAVANGVVFTFQRNLLLIFDVVLLVVTALSSYQISSRNPEAPRDWLDRTTLLLLMLASVIDVFALFSTLVRTIEMGLSINRAVAIGMNIVLLVNLSVSAAKARRFNQGKADFDEVTRWQANYLPVYFVWAAVAALLLPVLFGFK